MRNAILGALVLLLWSAPGFTQGTTAKPAAKPAAQTPAAPKPATPQTAPAPATPRPAAPRPAAPKPATPAVAESPAEPPAPKSPDAGPVIVLDTVKGRVEIETYPNEAPKTVEHILALVKRNFYNGQRVHRVVKGFVIQFGDPQTRDVRTKELWGRGPAATSGKAIGVAEINPKRTHNLGAVAMAHAGNAAQADSQMYITLAPVHRLDKEYAVWGQVISGMDAVQKIEVGDMIRKATIRVEPKATN